MEFSYLVRNVMLPLIAKECFKMNKKNSQRYRASILREAAELVVDRGYSQEDTARAINVVNRLSVTWDSTQN
jgi:hypothetical protein